MSKRPTNDDNKNIQLELMATEETKRVFNLAEVTRKHYLIQAGIVGKLYNQATRHVSSELTVAETKQLADTMRNLSIWLANFHENLSLVEQKEAEKVIALGDRIDPENMTPEQIRQWI